MEKYGYVVFKSLFQVSRNLIEDVKTHLESNENLIFNYGDALKSSDDGKRSQASIEMTMTGELLRVREKIKEAVRSISPNLILKDWVAIRSKPGCQRQAAHCDYEPTQIFMECPDNEKPLGVLLSIDPKGSRLWVWPGSHKIHSMRAPRTKRYRKGFTSVELKLRPGDAVVFRGDLTHAGAAYREENFRIHSYADSAYVERSPDVTWLMKKDADEWKRTLLN